MAYYAYKTVRDLLPEHIIKQMGDDYEGDGNYDGDQWYAAEAYILELQQHRKDLLEALQATQIDLRIMRGNVFSAAKTENRWDGMVGLIDEWITRNDEAISKALGK